ncbi:LytR/AlgR family response regulator transcription factor [Brevibacillus dissolubilis]|uniref:LytR/AlgR family response regulator transcription factor n=1 Tax=Brevibacillus dissolubilis TaxID=1844116 RepID=UPI001115D7A5|nr:LytTR family DNA-binding domain-containing protein [Brevibacillus dissolubilis]
MEEIRAVIADDDELSRAILHKMLRNCPGIHIVGEAADGEELIRQVIMEQPHLIYVDISMPRMDGMKAVHECIKLQPKLKVIFITAYVHYAVDAFDISAVDYVVKPVEQPRLFRATERARQAILSQGMVQQMALESTVAHTAPTEKEKAKAKHFFIRSEGSYHFVPQSDILYIEKLGRKAMLHTANNIYEMNETLGSIINRLGPGFLQCHRSYIINSEHVEKITPFGETNTVHFRHSDKHAYISKNKLNEIIELIDASLDT